MWRRELHKWDNIPCTLSARELLCPDNNLLDNLVVNNNLVNIVVNIDPIKSKEAEEKVLLIDQSFDDYMSKRSESKQQQNEDILMDHHNTEVINQKDVRSDDINMMNDDDDDDFL